MILVPIKKDFKKSKAGFTLVECVVSAAIFAILAMAVYGIASSITRGALFYRQDMTISRLADQYLEIARNIPYSQIGTINGNPHGILSDLPNATIATIDNTSYKIYYAVSYVDDPADGTALAGTDPAPNDYKQIKLYIQNVTTGLVSNFLTTIAPKGLEGLSSGGALSIQVINSVGQPVPNATITITNNALTPRINLTRTADSSGNWIEVGLPDSANSYHIVVTKGGYSTDQTYPISGQNPNPIKADSTISNGQVTRVSFAIDQLSTLVFNTLNQTCGAMGNIGLEVRGSKLIGTPNVLKFDNNYISDSNGLITLNNLEWDNYTPILTAATNMIYGSSPIQQVNLSPNTSQQFALILGPKTTNSLLVIVKDSSTQNAIEGVNVELKSTSPSSDGSGITGGSTWTQNSWTGGSGQIYIGDPTMYSNDSGSISTGVIPYGLRLYYNGTLYSLSGTLTSSTFDTGTASSTYSTISWQPTSQDPATSIKFQIATNNDNLTWNFVGPDGTSATYYTVSGTMINSVNNNSRYVRYKAFLNTTDTSKTPVLTSVSINYVSGCSTPGQVMFPGLSAGSNYQLIAGITGYSTQTINNINISGNNVLQVLLSH